MLEKELVNCNPEVCDLKFQQFGDIMKELKLDGEQRREEVQAIKEAMIAIKGAYEQTSKDVSDIKSSLPKQDDKMWKLLDKLITFLMTGAGIAIGMNITQLPK